MSGSRLKMSLTVVAAALFSMAAVADNSKKKADDTWISVSGTVESVSDDTFILNYGIGKITVEMDDGDRDADAYRLDRGNKVTVTGKVDDGLYEKRTIEASSVYVKDIDTYFYASAFDEEKAAMSWLPPVSPSDTWLQGRILSVDDNSFVVDSRIRPITVEIDQMAYNPLDDKGYQQLDKGDLVRVWGNMGPHLITDTAFKASRVTTLDDVSR